MDIYASIIGEREIVNNYMNKHYGPVPRYRGIRFMRYEAPENCRNAGKQSEVWAKYCGKDIVYIHTRCGGCGDRYDTNSNYVVFGADKWEEGFKDLFLESVDDDYDPTYRDHYFTAVIDDDYNKICNMIEEGEI